MELRLVQHVTVTETSINVEIDDGPEYYDKRTGQLWRVVSVNWVESIAKQFTKQRWLNILGRRIKKDGDYYKDGTSRIGHGETEDLVRKALQDEGYNV